MRRKPKQKKRGPEPEMLKLNGDRKDAIRRSFQEKKPKEGWASAVFPCCSEQDRCRFAEFY
jgi:hypothetical protein